MLARNLLILAAMALGACGGPSPKEPAAAADTTSLKREPHRPLVHFSPKEKWMNDPNGMVFFGDTYHLFYQYYPDSTVWGPMHWGHATSADMVHWEHQPIALYPDSLGYIFSGSAVVDSGNTSGFGSEGKVPLVAIFTHHDPKGEKDGSKKFQNQSIAYSLDSGRTWTKYPGNPVLKNPGIKDFRDPKVSWHPETGKWIMTLATLDRITFYSSPNLKDWTKESEFGKQVGAHGGVWECPDLFPMMVDSQKVWILFVSINPGGPNGGSATQYFTGQFDGHKFTPLATDTRWIDWGPDNYAGVTWANTGARRLFLGWMSNWQYATVVPTEAWRSAMTVPRELGLRKEGDQFYIRSWPAEEVSTLFKSAISLEDVDASNLDLSSVGAELHGAADLEFETKQLRNFTIELSNADGQRTIVGYDSTAKEFYIDRTKSGKINFEKGFASRTVAKRLSPAAGSKIRLIIDVASLEFFADDGLTVMTGIFFPNSESNKVTLKGLHLSSLKWSGVLDR